MSNNGFSPRVVRAVLSGTFKRDPEGLAKAYGELHAFGCQVLSPHRIDFVSNERGFVKTAKEESRPSEELQRHHIFSIGEADFVWLHAPEGYVGTSAAFEVGYAFAKNVPVFCRNQPAEPALEPFVRRCRSLFDALYEMQ